ncbi:5-hydroxytryptamine receptor 4-like [Gigantopelta aegis]|uniref:5-hydroxytryptamine receptor 4-like n=1 Tax=Gigantopelta aegis TaxID=1735272 RepID=UPI001B88D6D8|nr:5-hydroxytryptamine receptor 4-like [Gigantopelta aegis]
MSNNSTSSYCDAILASSAGPPPVYNHTTQMAMTAMLGIFMAIAFLGNVVLILTIVKTRQLHTRANFFVASLATSDIGVSLLVMPFGIYQQASNKEWRLGEVVCLLSTSVDVMLCTVSSLHLLCLCLDRYLAICHPYLLQHVGKRLTCQIIVACWVLPIFISFLPIMNKWNTIGIEHFIACLVPPEGVCVFLVNPEFAVICSIVAFYIRLGCKKHRGKIDNEPSQSITLQDSTIR